MSERGIDYLVSPAKRRLDVAGSIAIGAALVPFYAATGIVSAIDTEYINPIFRQKREGQGGKIFEVVKFRTLAKSLEDLPVKTYGAFDPRAHKIGQFLRQTGIDELPQIVNVIQGNMSLVGMRPLIQADIQYMHDSDPKLYEDWYEYYRRARPGLVGTSQVLRHHFLNGITPELYRESMRMDIEYSESATLGRDLSILMKSPFDMIKANVGVIDNVSPDLGQQAA